MTMAMAKWMAQSNPGPAREQAENEPQADGQLQVDRDGRQDAWRGEAVVAQELREFPHALAARDVVPDAPDEEQSDENAQQQQREVGEPLRGGEEHEFAHDAQD